MIISSKKIKKWLIGILLPVAFMVNSCDYSYIDGLDNIQPYTYSPVMAVPLINSSLGIDDIIGRANYDEVYIDSEGLVWLVFRGSVPVVTPYDIIRLPNRAETYTFSLSPPAFAQPQTIERIFDFQLGAGVELDSIKLLSGLLNIQITSPALLAAGYSLSSNFEIIGSSSGVPGQPIRGTANLQTPGLVNLAGNAIDINQPGNFITIRQTFTLSGSGNPAAGPFDVTVNKSFADLEYDVITGYLGTRSFLIGGTTITLDLFENLGLEETTIEAPRIEVIASNSYGVPFNISVNQFSARNTDNNITRDITLPSIYSPWMLNRANILGDTSITIANLHRDNTNLTDIAAINPNQYIYIVTGTTNPTGRQMNFVRHNSTLNLDLEINVPMWGRVRSFEINDTVANPLDTIPQEVEWAEMNINIDNGIPVGAQMQVYFANSLGNKIDSLFGADETNNFIEAAPANQNTGIANDTTRTNMRLMLSQRQIESLRNTRNFIVVADLMTYNQQTGQFVKILNTNKLDVRIGVRIKAAVELDL